MFKKWMTLLLASLLLTGCSVPTTSAYPIGENSMDAPLAKAEAEALAGLHLLRGTGRGYELERLVTRAEAAAMAVRMVGQEGQLTTEPSGFSDTRGHWADPYIALGVQKGYINGISEDRFAPEAPVTGPEFVKLLLGAMGYQDLTLDNVYDTGIAAELLVNNYVKEAAASTNYRICRSDMVYLCYAALLAKTASGGTVLDALIAAGVCTQAEADFLLIAQDAPEAEPSAAWRMRAFMPQDQNYLYAPFSIQMALAMAANGASGETREEILSLLPQSDLDAYNAWAQALLADYASRENVAIEVANSIWRNTDHASGMDFLPSYRETIAEVFGGEAADVTRADAKERIDSWVAEKTHDKITEILPESMAEDPEFLAALVNAVYFKGQWASQFHEKRTSPDTFTDRNGEAAEVDFMHQTARFDYYSDDTIQMVALPYEDPNFRMYILLSDNPVPNPEAYIPRMENRRVDLSLPKFRTEYMASLKDMLVQMGMTRAFNMGNAQFGNMFALVPGWNACISEVLHKTYIDVDEAGTEAAAVTVIGMAGGASSGQAPPPPVVFTADRPFTYFIRDDKNEQVLFIGEYAFAN